MFLLLNEGYYTLQANYYYIMTRKSTLLCAIIIFIFIYLYAYHTVALDLSRDDPSNTLQIMF